VSAQSGLLQALAYSVGGFLVGYGSAWATRRAAENEARAPGRRTDWWRVPVGLLLLFLVGYYTISATTFAACQREANTQMVAALQQRSEAQRDWIAAQEVFLDATADPHATPESKLAAYRAYRAALTQLRQVQAANPLQVQDCS